MRTFVAVTLLLVLGLIPVSGSQVLVDHDKTRYQQEGRGSDSSCFVHFGFDDETIIQSGDSFQSRDNDSVYLGLSVFGNLAIWDDGRILWESGSYLGRGDYWTELVQDQGFIATYKGKPDDRDDLVWTSASSSSSSVLRLEKYWVWEPDGKATKGKSHPPKPPVWGSSGNNTNDVARGSSSTQYFFGMDCDYTYVAVFEGTPDDPGDWIWRARLKPTESPTWAPTEVSPTEPPTEPLAPFAFYCMGDVPYTNDEAEILKGQINQMNNWIHPESLFMVHLGDFNHPDDTDCQQSHFNDISDILWNAPLPTFVLAGDNDFLECPDEEDAWYNYLNTFLNYEEEWSEYRKLNNVLRWDYDAYVDGYGQVSRPDMFAFYQEGILFMSLALLNMKNEDPDRNFREREAVSLSWARRRLREYVSEKDFRGVVLFSHAEHSGDLEQFFEDDLRQVFDDENANVPVLYLCGDSHYWDIEEGKYSWSEFTYVSVDRGACADPLLIEVAPVIAGETQYFEK